MLCSEEQNLGFENNWHFPPSTNILNINMSEITCRGNSPSPSPRDYRNPFLLLTFHSLLGGAATKSAGLPRFEK